MEEKDRWYSPPMMEVPFWRDDMTLEEYEEEYAYYEEHYADVQRGIYEPLWKQKIKRID